MGTFFIRYSHEFVITVIVITEFDGTYGSLQKQEKVTRKLKYLQKKRKIATNEG